jgi:hypothetical protein
MKGLLSDCRYISRTGGPSSSWTAILQLTSSPLYQQIRYYKTCITMTDAPSSDFNSVGELGRSAAKSGGGDHEDQGR